MSEGPEQPTQPESPAIATLRLTGDLLEDLRAARGAAKRGEVAPESIRAAEARAAEWLQGAALSPPPPVRAIWVVALAGALGVVVADGYRLGAWVRIMAPFLLPSWVALAGCTVGAWAHDRAKWARRRGLRSADLDLWLPRPLNRWLLALALFAIVPILAHFAGRELRAACCRHICAQCEPLIQAIEEERRAGRLDAGSPRMVQAMSALSVTSRMAEFAQNGAFSMDVFDGPVEDVIVYVGPNRCVLMVAMERPFWLMSITGYDVYLWESDSREWWKEHMVWTLRAR